MARYGKYKCFADIMADLFNSDEASRIIMNCIFDEYNKQALDNAFAGNSDEKLNSVIGRITKRDVARRFYSFNEKKKKLRKPIEIRTKEGIMDVYNRHSKQKVDNIRISTSSLIMDGVYGYPVWGDSPEKDIYGNFIGLVNDYFGVD